MIKQLITADFSQLLLSQLQQCLLFCLLLPWFYHWEHWGQGGLDPVGVRGCSPVSQGLYTVSWRRGNGYQGSGMLNTGVPHLQKMNQEQTGAFPMPVSNVPVSTVRRRDPHPFSLFCSLRKSFLSIFLNRAISSVHHLFFIQVQHHALPALSLLKHPAGRTFLTRKASLSALWRLLSSPAAASGTLMSHCGFLTMVSRTTISFHTWPWFRDTAEHSLSPDSSGRGLRLSLPSFIPVWPLQVCWGQLVALPGHVTDCREP